MPERKTRTTRDGRVIPIFEPMPDGSVSPEEQAWADEEQRGIIAARDKRLKEARDAEKASVEAKEKRAAEKRKAGTDLAATVADLVKRVAELEKANG